MISLPRSPVIDRLCVRAVDVLKPDGFNTVGVAGVELRYKEHQLMKN